MNDREKDDYFNKIFKEHAKGREEHEFKHFNEAMGIQIYGKAHYYAEMKKRGMVPFEETERLAEQYDKENPRKEYDNISPGAMEIIRSLKMSADKHGNICMGGRAIEAMKKIGAIKPVSEHAPEEYTRSGGFN
jgi:beta-phosphoglucomutase-like phosphatase (HAD superfamily)